MSEHSGKWVGQSIQDGRRITEAIMIAFEGSNFTGSGWDSDGLFDLTGEYDCHDQMVQITRQYTKAPKNPSQVGYPFIYIGRWDGTLVAGRWMMSTMPSYGGTFEMWPEGEEEAFDFMSEVDSVEESLALPAR